MATLKQCDRCKRAGGDLDNTLGAWSTISVPINPGQPRGIMNDRDICKPCLRELLRWLDERPVEAAPASRAIAPTPAREAQE